MGPDNNWCSQCGRTDSDVENLKELLREAVGFGLHAAEGLLYETNNFAWKGVINRLKAIGASADA